MIQGSCHCGAVRWQFLATPESATACNCTACRRYGALWAYDYEDEGIRVSGPTRAYVRGTSLGFHFCPECGCVAYWRSLEPGRDGRRRIQCAAAVHVRAEMQVRMVRDQAPDLARGPGRAAGRVDHEQDGPRLPRGGLIQHPWPPRRRAEGHHAEGNARDLESARAQIDVLHGGYPKPRIRAMRAR